MWDAEDLVQETLARTFNRLALTHYRIESPRSYLLRTATNLWLNSKRRTRAKELADEYEIAGRTPAPVEIEDATETLLRILSPQERVAVVLKDIFAFSLSEIALAISTSEGAVKHALFRGRDKLGKYQAQTGHKGGDATGSDPDAARPSRELVEALAVAFTARDIDAIAALLCEDTVASVVGFVHEERLEKIRAGSLPHTLPGVLRAEVVQYEGEPIVAVIGDEEGKEVTWLFLRIEEREQKCSRLSYYFFTPEVIKEIGQSLGREVSTHGHFH